ncbi:type I 3-dehydroquinate dehydratase [Marinococcus halophilus]|uniref:type I 3-dehydroquinate dehydratase n=1 Tax=Marinococcus halophilus TaxID=1371 RepID=UPI0009A78533|nr:type I 3-dehydroquinate dehydratase [Marinococcus halophilus]
MTNRKYQKLQIGNKSYSASRPMICVPLTGETTENLVEELQTINLAQADAIEWRADHFKNLKDIQAVRQVLQILKQKAPGCLLLFTIRSAQEGGADRRLTDEETIELILEAVHSKNTDIVDIEGRMSSEHIAAVYQKTRECGVKMLISHHDFSRTPAAREMNRWGEEAERNGADIVKMAVMPNRKSDVLNLLGVLAELSEKLTICTAAMAMGPAGIASRLVGHSFGSMMIFASGKESSAPGQIPLEEARLVIDIVNKYS